jgi:3-oxoadipate enol-lactonase
VAKPAVKAVLLSPQRSLGDKPLLIVGPSLGTSSVLWGQVGSLLGNDFDVVAWDLPGHGVSAAAAETFSVADLADAVVELVDSIAPGEKFHYAGVSLGGATGLQLGIKHGDRLKSLSVQCSGAKLGTPEGWLERAETVRTQGTPVMIQGSAERWFAPGFMDREPEFSSRLLHSLRDADRFSYAFCCEALAASTCATSSAASPSRRRWWRVRWMAWPRRRSPKRWPSESPPAAAPPQQPRSRAWHTWRPPRHLPT